MLLEDSMHPVVCSAEITVIFLQVAVVFLQGASSWFVACSDWVLGVFESGTKDGDNSDDVIRETGASRFLA